VEWEAKRLRLPDTKSGEEQFIPLSGAALAILEATPRVHVSPFLFPGLRKRGHEPRPIANLSDPWKQILKRAELSDLRIHDLRRTVGSYLSQSGVELNVIKEGLRHASISTTLTYARLGADPAREALEAHGKAILRGSKTTNDEEITDTGDRE
jgi:integrase